MKDCTEIFDILNLYLDAAADGEQIALCEEHMAACDGCRRLFDELSYLRLALSKLDDDVDTPEGFTARVMARLEREKQKKRLRLFKGTGAVAAAAALITVALWAAPYMTDNMSMRAGSASSPSEAFAAPMMAAPAAGREESADASQYKVEEYSRTEGKSEKDSGGENPQGDASGGEVGQNSLMAGEAAPKDFPPNEDPRGCVDGVASAWGTPSSAMIQGSVLLPPIDPDDEKALAPFAFVIRLPLTDWAPPDGIMEGLNTLARGDNWAEVTAEQGQKLLSSCLEQGIDAVYTETGGDGPSGVVIFVE